MGVLVCLCDMMGFYITSRDGNLILNNANWKYINKKIKKKLLKIMKNYKKIIHKLNLLIKQNNLTKF